MCMALYLATDKPVPETEWREGESVFVVQALTDHEEPVRLQFTKPAVCYLGAHTGCSCGFVYGQDEPTSADEERDELLGRRSVDALRAFLVQAVDDGHEVELFACWEGDLAIPPEAMLEVTPLHFGGESFTLPEKVFYRVRSAAQRGDRADEARRPIG